MVFSALSFCRSLHNQKFPSIPSRLTKAKSLSNIAFTPVLVSIEGNIGSGKSTLLKDLKARNTDFTFIAEPVDTWSKIKNDEGESMLEVFYKDRKRWSYTFQNCALLTRYQYIEETIQKAAAKNLSGRHIFLTERCLDTDFHVFTKMLRGEGSIDKLELELYLRLLSQLKATATPLSALIHVNTKPVLCSERIKKRSRSGESSISMDYLQSLDDHQCAWINNEMLPKLITDGENIAKVESFIRSLI